MNERICILWNPQAGRAAEAAPLLDALQQREGILVQQTESGRDATIKARQAAERGAELVIAGGGDGTVNDVLNGLVDHLDVAALGVLPLGTANDFSFTLGMPDDLQQALLVLEQPEFRRIDLGMASLDESTTAFANVVTGGNSQRVTELLTDEIKEFWGPMCYLRGSLEVFSELTTFRTTFHTGDGRRQELDVLNVIIGNGRTAAGRLDVAPQASLEDGLLDVIIVLDGPPLQIVETATRFFLTDYLESEQVLYQRVESVSINSNPPMGFSIDGELRGRAPAEFQVRPQALRVLVGPHYSITPPLTPEAGAQPDRPATP